jgi:hypothetical protein
MSTKILSLGSSRCISSGDVSLGYAHSGSFTVAAKRLLRPCNVLTAASKLLTLGDLSHLPLLHVPNQNFLIKLSGAAHLTTMPNTSALVPSSMCEQSPLSDTCDQLLLAFSDTCDN